MRYLLVAILLIFFFNTQAQRVAHFESKVFFEDAVGNKDTITIGFDPSANSDFNPSFGEIDIQTPFDSIFEVRAAHGGSFWERDIILSKKIISSTESVIGLPYACDRPRGVVFVMNAKYQPVTISWDSQVFHGDSCIGGGYITHFATHLQIPWWELWERENRYYCLSSISSMDLYLGPDYYEGMYAESYYEKAHEVEGKGIDTLYGTYLGMTIPGLGTFACDITTSIPSVQLIPAEIYPNPTTGILYFKGEPLTHIRIFDQQGRLVFQGREWQYSRTIDVSHLPRGVYFLYARSQKREVIKKILKH